MSFSIPVDTEEGIVSGPGMFRAGNIHGSGARSEAGPEGRRTSQPSFRPETCSPIPITHGCVEKLVVDGKPGGASPLEGWS